MMKTNREHLQLKVKEENVLMIDRYQMGRIKLEDFFIRDQFNESRHPLGRTRTYFWQSRREKGCTIKVEATTTDSNEQAHKVMDIYMSQLVHPADFKMIDEEVHRSFWFKNTEIEKVHFVTSHETYLAAIFIWGNVFFNIQSSGENVHSIQDFVHDLEKHWVDLKPDKDHLPDFEVVADKSELKMDESITLSRIGPNNEHEYNSFIYIAGPKRLVELYKENEVFKLRLKKVPKKNLVAPSVVVLGVLPTGKFVRSKRLKFSIAPE